MLSPSKLLRLARRGADGPLLDGVIRNGFPLPFAARARLQTEANLRLAAIGLGLQRAVQLSYGPTPELEAMTELVVAELGEAARAVRAEGLTAGMGTSESVGAAGLAAACAGVVEAAEFLVTAGSGDAGLVERVWAAVAAAGARVVELLGRNSDGIDAAMVVLRLGGVGVLGSAAGSSASACDASVSAALGAAEAIIATRSLESDPACASILALGGQSMAGESGRGSGCVASGGGAIGRGGRPTRHAA